jgi:hypothetical protein
MPIVLREFLTPAENALDSESGFELCWSGYSNWGSRIRCPLDRRSGLPTLR